jgi:hypothetical protein
MQAVRMKKVVLSFFLLLFVSISIFFAEAGQEINGCPVPDSLKIIAPDSGVVPPKLALLSGIWEGYWAQPVIFIVERIEATEAFVVLAWAGARGKAQTGLSLPPGYVRLKCPIEQGGDETYRIICNDKTGTSRWIQTNNPKQLRVERDGFIEMPDQYRNSIFTKKEIQ